MSFTGTLDKCKACDKTVYVVELLSLEGNPYHKSCFKCSHCKGTLSMSSYSWMDGVLSLRKRACSIVLPTYALFDGEKLAITKDPYCSSCWHGISRSFQQECTWGYFTA